MAVYKVIKEFMDLKDGNHIYKAGDIYPRDGSEPTEERIAELASGKNRQKQSLIGKVEEPEPQKEAEEPAAEAKTAKSKKATATKGKKAEES